MCRQHLSSQSGHLWSLLGVGNIHVERLLGVYSTTLKTTTEPGELSIHATLSPLDVCSWSSHSLSLSQPQSYYLYNKEVEDYWIASMS